MKPKILIYGASGFVGKELLDYWKDTNLELILAGRGKKIALLAKKKKLPHYQLFPEDLESWSLALKDVTIMINLAGSSAKTAEHLVKACLLNHCHYVDIAGEFEVSYLLHQYHDQAQKAGVILLPAAGFGVVPMDLAAFKAVRENPTAKVLEISSATVGGASKGTLKTVLGSIEKPGIAWHDEKLVTQNPGIESNSLSLKGKIFKTLSNPWRADLLTASYSTGIKAIKAFSNFPGFVEPMMKRKTLWLRNLILGPLFFLFPEGPSKASREKGQTYVKAVARGNAGSSTVSLVGPEAYDFTLLCLDRVMKEIVNRKRPGGFYTPSQLSPDLLDGLSEVEWLSADF